MVVGLALKPIKIQMAFQFSDYFCIYTGKALRFISQLFKISYFICFYFMFKSMHFHERKYYSKNDFQRVSERVCICLCANEHNYCIRSKVLYWLDIICNKLCYILYVNKIRWGNKKYQLCWCIISSFNCKTLNCFRTYKGMLNVLG